MICKTKHYFFDHQYKVFIENDQILIGKQKESIKYRVPFSHKMLILWMFQKGKFTGFKILLKEKWKQFDMNHEDCLKFKKSLDGRIGYSKIESLYKFLGTVGLGSYSEVLKLLKTRYFQLKVISIIQNTSPRKWESIQKMCLAQGVINNLQLFNNELKALQNLKHPHIIKLKEFYLNYADCYIITNYIEGESLAKFLRYNKKISSKEIINILKQSFEALSYIHENGFIHRDIKPENIIYDKDHKFITLIDFGFATRIGLQEYIAGTPGYTAPELFDNVVSNEKCDIFSLGCILYELIYGKKLFQGQSLFDIQFANRECQYTLNLTDHPLHDLLRRMLEIDLSNRIVAKEGLNLLLQFEQNIQI
ncbi:unnamed protein product (macronuclear) [Paramecium tetraurelia]|uniref:Protein kinase domain-containing protein n=1 Tax=Paramecium tetraurelia TaxID=5888 RepID=A0BTJ6_PARTE|nr:uncharacterized protein GSPATT00032095001 [Paramecium tetraurelia]CAK61863.1 unnamed protein product [Paramecium tetraurelia]|eukprot:XP_001429261.1 hypothetical protein (macronuclear) [Paramecium tetraurelia strain d4-2]